MKKYKKYIILFCAVLTLLLAACSADGQKRQITPDELDPTLNQEIDLDYPEFGIIKVMPRK